MATKEINTNAQDNYVNGNRYRLEIKTQKTGSDTGPVSQPIHLVVDWDDVSNRPDTDPLVFGTRYEFPTLGVATKLYVATDENRVYRWDEPGMRYVIVGSDWHEISLIDCGGAQ